MSQVNKLAWLDHEDRRDRLIYESIENLQPRDVPKDRLYPTETMLNAGLSIKNPEQIKRSGISYTPVQSLHAIHGWLSPQGELFACGFKQHDILIQLLGFQYELHAENAGWCKLCNMQWLVDPRYLGKPLSRQQLSSIKRWYQLNGFPVSHYNKHILPEEF